jgi:hypothetical protein
MPSRSSGRWLSQRRRRGESTGVRSGSYGSPELNTAKHGNPKLFTEMFTVCEKLRSAGIFGLGGQCRTHYPAIREIPIKQPKSWFQPVFTQGCALSQP